MHSMDALTRRPLALVSALCTSLALTACSSPSQPGGGDGSVDASTSDSSGDTLVTPDSSLDAIGPPADSDPVGEASVADAVTSPVDAAPGDAAPPSCPTYQSFCGGRCIPTSVDPMNCGGCGVRCAAGEVCVSNGCTSTCPRGLTACAGSCVDTQSDSANCGACGTACPSGMGCTAGRCVTGAILTPGSVPCAGGGPAIEVGGFEGGATRCTGEIATVAFRWAVCSCRDLQMSALLLTDGFSSERGPYMPGQLGGSVGVNNRFSNSNVTNVGGSLWVGGSNGIGSSAPQTVRQELHVDGPLQTSNTYSVGADGFVNGGVMTSSTVTFTGALHVPEGATVATGVTYRRLTREAVSVPDPCDCTPSAILPIGDIVAFHRTRNDNAALGLDPAHFERDETARRVDLPCGRYYLTQIRGSTPLSIVAHGRTALFIGGDISTSSTVTITLDPTATLDVFIAGAVRTSAPLRIGSASYPALTRLYIGGNNGFQVSNTSDLGANFYVPNGPVQTSAPLEVFGAVFAGDFQTSNTVSVHYDRQVLRAVEDCTPRGMTPVGDGGAPSTDAASPDGAAPDSSTPRPVCGSCRDCANQACIGGSCGACRTSADCCAPLQCYEGRCEDIPG